MINYLDTPAFDLSISIEGCLVIFLVSLCFIEVSVLNANSVDTGGTPQNAASDLGLHCLPIIILGISRLKSVNQTASIISKTCLFKYTENFTTKK